MGGCRLSFSFLHKEQRVTGCMTTGRAVDVLFAACRGDGTVWALFVPPSPLSKKPVYFVQHCRLAVGGRRACLTMLLRNHSTDFNRDNCYVHRVLWGI